MKDVFLISNKKSKTTSSPSNIQIQQQDVTVPSGINTSNPHIVNLPIEENLLYNRIAPHVLEFIAGSENVVRTIFNFDSSDKAYFNEDEKYVTFDGVVSVKTNYTIPMKNEGVLGDGVLFSINIEKNTSGIHFTNTEETYTFQSVNSLNIS